MPSSSSTAGPAGRRGLRALATAVVLAVLASLPPASAATPDTPPEGGPVDDGWLPGPGPDAAEFSAFEGEPPPGGGPVWPGVMRDARRTTLADGRPVDVQILHLGSDAAVQVRPTLAGGTVRGLGTVASQSGDPLAGAVAAVNGGFWLGDPFGEPNGLFSIDARLVSDAESQGVGPRGAVGWTADGRVLIDRVDSTQALVLPDGTPVAVDGINRGHREHDELFGDGVDSVLAYTPDYGGHVVVRQPEQPTPGPTDPPPPAIPGDPQQPPPGPAPVDLAVLRIDVPRWPATGALHGTVIGISRDVEATFTADPGQVILVGTGRGATALDAVSVGDVVQVTTTLSALDPARTAGWAGTTRALAGGPMIVKDGRMTAPGDWVDEGFEPHVHSDVRAPRTAIGVTAEGRTLMVTADGRRPGITHGFTIAELAEYMIALGAVEALSLDGGGSSQLVVDGVLRNVPCCDAQTRPVADSLQVVHGYTFEATRRLAGDGRVRTAAAIARDAHGSGTTTALLAVAGSFPDALAGGPLAAALGAPLLLTGTDAVPEDTLATLRDLGVGRVRLLGGEAVISDAVVQQLAGLGLAVDRIAGDSRFDTAARIAESVQAAGVAGDGPSRVFLVPAGTFQDALVAAGPGGLLGIPILLTDPASLHPASRAVLADADEVIVVDADGQLGTGIVAEVVATGARVVRFGGAGRYQAAAAINDWLALQVPLEPEVIIARGDEFPDALAGGPLVAARRAPLMLVPQGSIDADQGGAAWFSRQDATGAIDRVVILGGPAAVSSYHQWQLEELTRS